MIPQWKVTPEKVEAAIKRIVEVSRPRKLILFGSYVRGDTNVYSDLDILVVTGDEVQSSRKESIRIRRALRGISMPKNILVVPEGVIGLVKKHFTKFLVLLILGIHFMLL